MVASAREARMNRSLLEAVVRHAEALAADPAAAATDADLVRRFADRRDEAAFAALVRRHGPMVWGVCRHLLPNPADAEDAFQATFLALVRSARAVRAGAAVGGWLHGVAVRVATKARRSAVRRRQREERSAGGEADHPVPDSAWEELLAAVHEEVQRLPADLRTAFVLCDLEGVRQPDAAARLGWKPGTLTGRLARARQQLLDRLTHRGVAPAAASTAVGVGAATAGSEVPAELSDKVMTLATAAADAVPPVVSELAREGLPMALNTTKVLAAAVLVAGGLAVGVGAGWLPVADAQDAGGFPGAAGGVPTGGGQNPAKLAGGPPGSPGDSGLFGAVGGEHGAEGGDPAAMTMSGASPNGTRPRWEYQFERCPDTSAEFRKLLTARAASGWQFAGVVDFPTAGQGRPAAKDVVFQRERPRRTGTPVAPGSMPPGASMTPGMAGGMGPGLSGSPPAPGASPYGMPGMGMMGGSPTPPEETLIVITLKIGSARDVANVLSQLLTPQEGVARVVAVDTSNAIIVKATPAGHKAVTALLQKLDAPPVAAPAKR